MKYQMNLCDEPFESIRIGNKTIEMRLNKENKRCINVGDYIEFFNDNTDQILTCIVLNKYEYANFEELYKHHDKKTLGYLENEIANPDDMLIYYKKEDIIKYGVIGFEIKLLK